MRVVSMLAKSWGELTAQVRELQKAAASAWWSSQLAEPGKSRHGDAAIYQLGTRPH
jgi:hypothetical protein